MKEKNDIQTKLNETNQEKENLNKEKDDVQDKLNETSQEKETLSKEKDDIQVKLNETTQEKEMIVNENTINNEIPPKTPEIIELILKMEEDDNFPNSYNQSIATNINPNILTSS